MMKFEPSDIEKLEITGDIKTFKNNIAYVRTHIITKVLTKDDNEKDLEIRAKEMKAVSVQIIEAPLKVFNAVFQTERLAIDFAKSL